jgi:hypothetical protein
VTRAEEFEEGDLGALRVLADTTRVDQALLSAVVTRISIDVLRSGRVQRRDTYGLVRIVTGF